MDKNHSSIQSFNSNCLLTFFKIVWFCKIVTVTSNTWAYKMFTPNVSVTVSIHLDNDLLSKILAW